MVSDADAWAIKKTKDDVLLHLVGENLVGVGIGPKFAGNPPVATGDLAIVALVAQKLPPAAVPPAQLVPPFLDGVPTDVVELEPIAPQGTLQGGIRIESRHAAGGQEASADGTLGCLARTADQPTSGPPNVLLSNYHVLFILLEEDNQYHGAVGDKVMLPSCSGCCEPVVGTVLRGNKDIDAAVATIQPGQQLQARVHGVPVTGTLDLTPDNWSQLAPATMQALKRGRLTVHKYGARTALTTGIVRCVGTSLGRGIVNSDIVIAPVGGEEAFSQKGDSGSVVYDDSGRVVSLLWGGPSSRTAVTATNRTKQKLTWSTPIGVVERELRIRVATNPPVRIWRSPGVAPFTALHRDLAGTATGRELLDAYGRHQAEVRALLADDRRFVLAWHRGGGPQLVAALRELAEQRIGALPATLAGRPWSETVGRLADALPALVGPPLATDIRRLACLIASLGGSSYPQLLALLERGTAGEGAR